MPTAIETDIIDHEKRFWNYMKTRDADAAMKLTADHCMMAGARGVALVEKKDFAKQMSNGQWELKDFKFDDIRVRQLSDDVAVITYKVHEDLKVDGKPISLEAAEASTWVRKNGKWQCALHSESLVGDPYGRDRMAAH